MSKHFIERAVYGFDCDIYGHLNNANYFKFYEEARAEFFKHAGLSISEFRNIGINILVKEINISYKKEIKLEDAIKISTSIELISPVKIIWEQQVFDSADELCNICKTTTVFSANGKIKKIDSQLIEKVKYTK